MNRLANARVRAASANVPRHRFINVIVRGFGILGEQDGRAHDLSRLTIATLGHVNFNPGFL